MTRNHLFNTCGVVEAGNGGENEAKVAWGGPFFGLACLAAMVLLASCSTSSPLINWDSRIGNYTYDLALMDLGSPVRSATLPDGTLVVEWRVREAKSGTPDITNEGSYVPQSFADSPFPYATGPLPNRYLRLIFGRDQKLIGWERFQQYNL